MPHFAIEIIRLAHHMVTAPPDARDQMAHALTLALELLQSDRVAACGTAAATCPLATRRVAAAFDGLAASLSMASDHAGCIAEQASFIAGARRPPPAGM